MRAYFRSLSNRARLPLGLGAAAAIGLLTAGPRVQAKECPTFRPTPEHAILAAAEGSYDLSFSDGSTGTSTCRTALGGQWMLEQVKADFCGQGYEGCGATSYDPVRRKYVNVWIDSVSPAPLVSEGSYDPATKTLTLVGNLTVPGGTVVEATIAIVQKSADARTFTMTVPGPTGDPVELFAITYRRDTK
jgi:hypothetical protein